MTKATNVKLILYHLSDFTLQLLPIFAYFAYVMKAKVTRQNCNRTKSVIWSKFSANTRGEKKFC